MVWSQRKCLQSRIVGCGFQSSPVLSFSSANYSISEAGNAVRVTVRKWGAGAANG